MQIEGTYPVSARKAVDGWITTGIAFEDYARMSTHSHKASGERRLPTPVWAVNDGLLRELLVKFMEERAGFRRKQKGGLLERLERANAAVLAQRPRQIAVLTKLCKEYVAVKKYGAHQDCTDEEVMRLAEKILGKTPLCAEVAREKLAKKYARDWEIEIEGIDTYLRYTKNGGAGTVAAIVWLYYRVGLDSVGVGGELNLKPPHIRQILWRLHETWKGISSEHVPDTVQETKTEKRIAPPILAALELL